MNIEKIKEVVVKAKDEVVEFGSAHKAEILAFLGIAAVNALEAYGAYYAGCTRTMGIILDNEQRIRYAAAAATPKVDVHMTDNIPKK